MGAALLPCRDTLPQLVLAFSVWSPAAKCTVAPAGGGFALSRAIAAALLELQRDARLGGGRVPLAAREAVAQRRVGRPRRAARGWPERTSYSRAFNPPEPLAQLLAQQGTLGAAVARLVRAIERAAVALFAGLEHEPDIARERIGPGAEQVRGARQHGRVGIVAAGVHSLRLLRSKRKARVLGHWQCVHVSAQEHRRTGVDPAQGGDHTAGGFRAAHFEVQPIEGIKDGFPGTGQVESQLRMTVNLPSHGDRACLQTPGIIQ